MTVYTKSMMEALEEVRGLQTEAPMNSAMIAKLKKAYEPMRDKKISISNETINFLIILFLIKEFINIIK